MDRQQYQVAIIGGGIIGLSTALRLTERHPDCRVVVLEKEQQLAQHQTGHNSGVIHSGIYYAPGSSKAQFCTAGVGLLTQFCQENDIDFERCGKVIVATSESEFGRLDTLLQRGIANGVQGLEEIGPERLKEIEPHAFGLKAIWAPNTGIVDYKKVANAYAAKIRASGGEIVTGATVRAIRESEGSLVVETTQGEVKTSHLINCAGLAADRVARMMGIKPNVRIIPFRGEYYTLKDDRRDLVKGLIYPVPNPSLPFLGVHFTKRINGEVEAGPNAVLAFAREGYTKTSFKMGEFMDTLSYGGFWSMSRKFWKVGIAEMHRSFSKSTFVRDLRRLLPDITSDDVVSGGAGVRAQAVNRDGSLVDDFRIEETRGAIHVLNAPSPGATSSLAIGSYIVDMASKSFDLG